MKRGATRARGFTLIELVSALGAMSVLAVAMGSVLVVVRGAVPDPNEPTTATADAWRAAERFAHDLSTAVTFVDRGDGEWALELPDRDGDGVEEAVEWEWDADDRDATFAVTREFNENSIELVLARAKDVSVSTETRDGDTVSATVTVTISGDIEVSASVRTATWNLGDCGDGAARSVGGPFGRGCRWPRW